MARNFDRLRSAGRDWPANRRLSDLRRRLYRSADGKFLGVFKGIAESLGYCVFWVRLVGIVALLILAGICGAHGCKVTFLVSGFFYLLLALLMQPPRKPGFGDSSMLSPENDSPLPPPVLAPRRASAYARPQVDLAQLDRQLDSLSRRIQRMETIVTDREYDWNRRMES